MLFNFFSKEPITPRQLLALVLPALLIGLALRASLMWVLPEGYFGSDSASYYDFSQKFFDHGRIHLSEKRRWLYPLFLAFADGFPTPGWYLVPFFQHVIGLITLLGIGWSTAQLVERKRLIVPLVTVLAACWPRTIWYEHEFIAESLLLAAFVAVIALLLTPKIVESRLGFPLLMLAFVLLAGMKGAGRFLWIGSVFGLFLLYRDPRKWIWNKFSIALAGLSLLLVSTVGKSSQGDWLALSSSLPLVRTEGEPYSTYRSILKGQILEARTYGNDYPWVMHDYKKRLKRTAPESFHPEWGLLYKNKRKFSKIARAFWLDAISVQPFRFFSMTVKTIGIALSKDSLSSRFAPSKFWADMDQAVLSRWRRNPRYFDRLFGLNLSTYELRREQGSNATYSFIPALQFVSRHFSWLDRGPARLEGPIGSGGQGPFPSFSPRPLGVMALAGSVLGATISKRRQQCIVLLLPLLLYLFGTFAVGDAVSRYLQPVEWIGFVFAGVCIDFLFRFAEIFARRVQKSSP